MSDTKNLNEVTAAEKAAVSSEEAVKAAFRDAVVHEVLIFALKNLQPAEEAAE